MENADISDAISSENKYTFRQACEQDLLELLELINTQAIHDKNKIVILPKKFREMILKKTIGSGRLFVALDENRKIVGYKKLFLITDESEKQAILQDEIRCLAGGVKKYSGFIDESFNFRQESRQEDNKDILDADKFYDVCIYNGGDYTLPQSRDQGINSKLTDASLRYLKPIILDYLKAKNANKVSMFYGITDENSGDFPGHKNDRTVSISKSFIKFIKSLKDSDLKGFDFEDIVLKYKRYQAFMPTFDPESTELAPLPDDQSISGNGCVLTYEFQERIYE